MPLQDDPFTFPGLPVPLSVPEKSLIPRSVSGHPPSVLPITRVRSPVPARSPVVCTRKRRGGGRYVCAMRTGTRASLFRGGSDVLSHPQRRQSSRTAKTYHTIVSKFVHSLIFVHSSLAISLLFLYIIRLLSLVMSLLSILSRTLPFSWTLLSFCLYRFLFLSFETDLSLLSFSCIRHFFYHYSSSLIFIFYVPAVLQ